MVKNDALGSRMKQYEAVPKNFLMRKTPAVIRLDGKAFHSFTKGLEKPFDSFLMSVMQKTMLELCREISGCVFGYTQSDEITLVLTDYASAKTGAWFDYNVQKMVSVSASVATLAFNRLWREDIAVLRDTTPREEKDYEFADRISVLTSKCDKALFDARCFSLPKEEVVNCLIWRQKDASRNSVSAVGQANFSAKELHGKNSDDIQEMLWQEKKINWNDFPTACKRGSASYRRHVVTEMQNPYKPDEMILVERNPWVLDTEIPIFSQKRDFVEKWLSTTNHLKSDDF